MFPFIPTSKLHHLSKHCNSISQLKQILTQIIQTDISNHSFSLFSLLSFTIAHNHLPFASSLFSQLPHPTPFAYNTIIQSFTNSNLPNQAILFYLQMTRYGLSPDNFTYPFVLKSCSLLLAVPTGKSIHSKILQMGFQSDPFVQCSLIRMYSEFDEIDSARNVFDGIVERDVVLWNSMIGGYAKCGRMDSARKLFDEIPLRNIGTYNALRGGYVKLGDIDRAYEFFKEEMAVRDVVSWNTMIGGQAKFGCGEFAKELFDCVPEKNVATWSAIISGFCYSGQLNEALSMFDKMMAYGPKPNQAILVSLLSSCANSGALKQGVWIHSCIHQLGVEIDDWLSSSLIDMYSKCGLLKEAILVFNKSNKKDPCVWASMIYGLAIHGQSHQAYDRFGEMEKLGIRPNHVTFIAVLSACSHAGIVEKALQIFNKMQHVYRMSPKIEHYTCMVGLLCRANLVEEAKRLIRSMPMEPDVYVWGALVGGLRIHQCNGSKFENELKEELEMLKPRDSGPYVLASNIYAAADQWEEVERMRGLMKGFGVRKNKGWSLIEVEGVVHQFLASERTNNSKSDQVYQMLDAIYRGIKAVFLT